jgi:hypothetical protein
MSDKMVLLAIYGNPVEAELARAQLEAAGIPAALLGATSGGLFPGLGVGLSNVQLLVPEEQHERAAEVLDLEESMPTQEPRQEREGRRRRRKKQSTDIKEEEPAAPRCTEIRPAAESPVQPADNPAPPPVSTGDEEAANDPVEEFTDEQERAERSLTWTPDDMAVRAFRAAIFGYLTCGVWHLYVFWILVAIPFTEGQLSPAGARKAWAALVLAALPFAILSVAICAGKL